MIELGSQMGMICLNNTFCTTRLVSEKPPLIVHKFEDKFETALFLAEGKNRQGEGGLRTQGYFKNSLPDKLLITVITVVFNGKRFLEETIKSIVNQTYDNVEYIIIDGGSTDGTLDILQKYDHVIDYWVSERDHGISDAFNKAISISTGDYINFQGDGDGFFDSTSLLKVSSQAKLQQDILVSGKICRINESGAYLYTSKQTRCFKKQSLLFKMSLPHQGLFVNKNFFKTYGFFDLNNTYCMDYEHLLRAYSHFPKVVFVKETIAKWRDDGLGNGKTLEVLEEYNKIRKANSVASNFTLNLIHIWSISKYYLGKFLNAIR